MKRFLFLILLAVFFAARIDAATPKDAFFVATNGNDTWTGKRPTPNRNQTDGPFATLAHAIQVARTSARNRTIQLRSGTYFLDQPLILRPEDSNLHISADENASPVLSAGRAIAGWKETTINGKKVWSAQVRKPPTGGAWPFRELWINGRRATRARHPNKGYLSIDSLPDKASDWTQGHTRLRFKARELRNWSTITNAELIAMTRWVESRLPIAALDEKQRLVSLRKRSVFELAPGDPYYIEGALELLDEPGEWCLDTAQEVVFYIPRPNEKLAAIEAIAPVLPQILRIEGALDAAGPITNLVFNGITFSHAEWYFPESFYSGQGKPEISPPPKPEVGGFGQAAIGVPGVVWGEGVQHCRFYRCSFSHSGGYGLELARGCQSNQVVACKFNDLGGGGIKLGETTVREQTAQQSFGNVISDCSIVDGGRMFHSAIGIWIGHSYNNRIEHNLIQDFYYTGISVGWSWGYGKSLATNNLIQFNHVNHIGVRTDGDGPILSDMGGIYTLGLQPGTRISNNLWHDIAGLHYGGWGIYFDEGSSGIVAESNVVYRTTHGGFHQHYGETNVLRNNVFAFARDHQLQRSRPEDHTSFTFQTNIVYFNSGPLLGGDWSGDKHYVLDRNIYFDTRAGTNIDRFQLGPATFSQWHARGHDQHSVLADPLFGAPEKGDFTMKRGSPALKLGFQPIDSSRVGPRKETAR